MKVTNLPGGLNTVNDTPNEYDGQITIEIRSSSSQFFPKQSYALETQDSTGANNNVPLWVCLLKTIGSSTALIQTRR